MLTKWAMFLFGGFAGIAFALGAVQFLIGDINWMIGNMAIVLLSVTAAGFLSIRNPTHDGD